jgi:hypothetical protein
MLRKTMIALLAAASVAMLTPGMALARGGGGGGGGHGGGGFGGGGFHGGGGFGGGGFARSAAVGGNFARSAAIGGAGAVAFNHFHGGDFHHGFHRRGFIGGFGYDGPYAYDDGYGYYDDPSYYTDNSYYQDDSNGCYIVQQRVHTRYGWRLRPTQVCG